MPIYEYRCQKCGERFEKLVRTFSGQQSVVCPCCGSEEVQKAVSLFGLSGNSHSSGADPCGPRSL